MASRSRSLLAFHLLAASLISLRFVERWFRQAHQAPVRPQPAFASQLRG